MIEKVSGFITDDGQFFSTSEEAEFHEAGTILIRNVEETEIVTPDGVKRVDPAKFVDVLVANMSATRRYINAYEALKARTDQSQNVFEFDPGSVTNRAQDTYSIQQQPIGSSQSVPGVGSGEQPKAVRGKRKSDGA